MQQLYLILEFCFILKDMEITKVNWTHSNTRFSQLKHIVFVIERGQFTRSLLS